MSLISLICALMLEQWRPLAERQSLFGPVQRYADFLERQFNAGQAQHGVIAWTLAVIPPMVGAWIIFLLLARMSPIAALAFNVAVLYLTMGFRQFSHFYNDVMLALRAGDVARAREVLGRWRGESAPEMPPGEIARVAIEQGLIRSHRHVFGVMAWFIVLGPAGAIGYRLAALVSDRWGAAQSTEAGAFGHFAARAFEVIDWVPVRLTAFGFAMTGDFMGAVECWRAQAPMWRARAQGILLAAAAGALGVRLGGALHEDSGIVYRPQLGDGDEADVDYMQAAVGLIWRALVLWLFLILLATIASFF